MLFFFGSGTAWAQAQQQLERAGPNEAAETALFGETNFITLINNNSDKCVDLNGANAQQSTCIGIQEASQVWQLDPSGAGFQIVNTGNGNCLEVAGVSLNPGANVQQAACQEAAHHQWTFEVSGTGLTIRALHSNLCLEVAGSSTATGANIQQATCTGASNQEFRIGLPGDDYVSVERLPLAGTTACMVIEVGSNNLVANN